MIFRFEVRPQAREELTDTVVYYESLSSGLGVKFFTQWEQTIEDIATNPLGFQRKKKNFRQALIKKFPYLVIFEIENDLIVIYAVIHAKKRPPKRYKRK